MSNLIVELKDAGHVLTDEQKIQAVIRSLPHTWDNMKMHLTHNEGIKTLSDVSRHPELEEELLEAVNQVQKCTWLDLPHKGEDSSRNMRAQRERNERSRPGLPRTQSIIVVQENQARRET